MPAVSVIVPSFNRSDFLKLAIESVFLQSFADWELIIADDGSGEETQHYLQSLTDPKVRIVRLAHSGNPSAVRNAAAAVSAGRYLAFLDSDDVWVPSKLEKQLAGLQEHPRSRWSYTACSHIDAHGMPIPKKRPSPEAPEGWIFEKLLRLDIGIAMPTVMAERGLFAEVGGFDEQQRFGEFHDLCLRLALHGEVTVVREQLTRVRAHDRHYSSDKIANHAGWLQLYKKMTVIAKDPRLRRACARMRVHTSLRLARDYQEIGAYSVAVATVCRAFPYGWSFGSWWLGAFKCLLRPVVPNSPTSMFRKRRGRA
jgi:glycosyltransferase involved in cell wall biosynthesis